MLEYQRQFFVGAELEAVLIIFFKTSKSFGSRLMRLYAKSMEFGVRSTKLGVTTEQLGARSMKCFATRE